MQNFSRFEPHRRGSDLYAGTFLRIGSVRFGSRHFLILLFNSVRAPQVQNPTVWFCSDGAEQNRTVGKLLRFFVFTCHWYKRLFPIPNHGFFRSENGHRSVRFGTAHAKFVRFGFLVRFGSVRFGFLVRFGSIRFGLVRFGSVLLIAKNIRFDSVPRNQTTEPN